MAVVRQHHDQLMKEMLASVKGRWAVPEEAPTTTSSYGPVESQQKLLKKSVSDCRQPTQPLTVRSEASEWRQAQPPTRARSIGADVTSSVDSVVPTQHRPVSMEKQHSYSNGSLSPPTVGLATVQKPAAAAEVSQSQLRVTSAVAVRLGPRPYVPPSESLEQGQFETRSQVLFSPSATRNGHASPGSSTGVSSYTSRRQPPSGRSQDDSALVTAVRVLTSPVGRLLNGEQQLERQRAAVADQPPRLNGVDRHAQDSRRAQQSVRPHDDGGLSNAANGGWLPSSNVALRGDRLTGLENAAGRSVSSPRTPVTASASFSTPSQPYPMEAGVVSAANSSGWSPSASTSRDGRFSSLGRTASSSPATPAGAAAATASFSPLPDRSPALAQGVRSPASFGGGSSAAATWSTASSASTGSGAGSSGWLWSPSASKELSIMSPNDMRNGNFDSSRGSPAARNVRVDRDSSAESTPITQSGLNSGQANRLAYDRSWSTSNQRTVAPSPVRPPSQSAEMPYGVSASGQPPSSCGNAGREGKLSTSNFRRSASSSTASQLQRQLCLDINDVPLEADDNRVSVSELIQEFNGLSPPPQTPNRYATTQQSASGAGVLVSPRGGSAAASPRVLQHYSRSTSADEASSPVGNSKASPAVSAAAATTAARRQVLSSPPAAATPSASIAARERNSFTFHAGAEEQNGYAKNNSAEITKLRDRAQQFSFDVDVKSNNSMQRRPKVAYSQDDGPVLSKRSGTLSPKLKLDFANDPKILGFCAVCNETISAFVGGCISMGKKYHVSCLVCSQCGKELAEQTFYTIEGKPHCRDCFSLTLEKCSACHEVITGKLLRAAGSVYHLSCFVCAICKCFLEGKQFVLGADNRPLCVDDYYENYAPKCDGCRRPIIPEDGQESALQVRVFNRCFHVACCKCEICGKTILTQTSQEAACYPLDGRIVCKACGTSRIYTGSRALP